MHPNELINQSPRITMAYHYAGYKVWPKFDKFSKSHRWSCTLKCDKRRLRTSFYQETTKNPPSINEVINSLCMDSLTGEKSFHDFLKDINFKVEINEAERTWRACTKTTEKLKKFLGYRYNKFCQG